MPTSWILAAAAAAAAGVVAPPAPPGPATPLSEVVVAAGPPPKVVASFPAEGSTVSAGVLVLKLVFDQPMAPQAWSYGPAESKAFPHCLERPRLLADQRTSVLLCTVEAHQDYAIQINPTPRFASADGRAAKPIILHFSTAGVDVRNLHDALTQAGLTDADEPIMRWTDPGAGVSQSTPPGG
jgi:hypothetical protein